MTVEPILAMELIPIMDLDPPIPIHLKNMQFQFQFWKNGIVTSLLDIQGWAGGRAPRFG